MHPEKHPFSARRLLQMLLFLLLVVMIACSGGYAISGDEPIQDWYGNYIWRHLSGGQLAPMGPIAEKGLEPYGGLFDTLCSALSPLLPLEHFDARHLLNALTGWLILLFAARIARLLHSDRLAIITVVLLAVSPRFFGESMNNPKDIPFALGMTMGMYAVLAIARSWPALQVKHLVLFAASVTIALGVRPGGLLLFLYLPIALLLLRGKTLIPVKWRPVGLILLAAITGFALSLLTWPFALQNPVLNPLRALRQMSHYNLFSSIVFAGKDIDTAAVPWLYLPVWIGITVPLIVLLPLLLAPFWLRERQSRREWLFLLFCVIFPVLYAIMMHTPLYDGWRHFYFLYPPLVLFSARGILFALERTTRLARAAVLIVCIAGIGAPLAFSLRNHPLQAVYFNALAGGLRGAYTHYETDYYGQGLEKACYALAADAELFDARDSVLIASNCPPAQLTAYFARINPRIRVRPIFYGDRYDVAYDYGIFWSRWLDRSLLTSGYFPPAGAYRQIAADSVPLYALVRGGGSQADTALISALNRGDGTAARAYAEQIILAEPHNETLPVRRAEARLLTGDTAGARRDLGVALRLSPTDRRTLKLQRRLNPKD